MVSAAACRFDFEMMTKLIRLIVVFHSLDLPDLGATRVANPGHRWIREKRYPRVLSRPENSDGSWPKFLVCP